MSRPRIALSACLQGERTRYDGADKGDAALVSALAAEAELIAVCPEVELGMGVPREPIQLVRAGPGQIAWGGPAVRLLGRESGVDHTVAMERFCARRVAELAELGIDGFIFKRDSPSCGLAEVRVLAPDGSCARVGRGLFARALTSALPDLPVAEAEQLARDEELRRFLARCHLTRRARSQM